MTLPDKELLRRGEVLRGTGWSRELFAKFLRAKIITPIKLGKRAKNLFVRADVASVVDKLKTGNNHANGHQRTK